MRGVTIPDEQGKLLHEGGIRDARARHLHLKAREIAREIRRAADAGALAQEIESREHSERSLRASEARLERQTAALMALTGDRVIRFLDLRRAMQELTERAARALDVARVSVWRFSDDRSKLECLEIYASAQDRHSVGGELSVAEYPSLFPGATKMLDPGRR